MYADAKKYPKNALKYTAGQFVHVFRTILYIVFRLKFITLWRNHVSVTL